MIKKNEISVFKMIAVYVGAIIGAGFASGQEIFQFFGRFIEKGLWGLGIAGILFIFFTYKIMGIGYKFKLDSYSRILNNMKIKFIGKLLDSAIAFFLFGSFIVMISGTGALFSQQWDIHFLYGNIFMAVITTITIIRGVDSIVKANVAIVPLLIVGILILCFSGMDVQIQFLSINNWDFSLNNLFANYQWILSSVLYVAYNILLATPILLMLGSRADSTKKIRRASMLGGLIIISLAVSIYMVIILNIEDIIKYNIEIPMAYIASKISFAMKIMYILILLLGIYTTAVSSFYGFISKLNIFNRGLKSKFVVLMISGAAILFSVIGFSNLIKYLYTIEGYIGIIFLIIILRTKKVSE